MLCVVIHQKYIEGVGGFTFFPFLLLLVHLQEIKSYFHQMHDLRSELNKGSKFLIQGLLILNQIMNGLLQPIQPSFSIILSMVVTTHLPHTLVGEVIPLPKLFSKDGLPSMVS